ncbi:family 43 glycosylhydrolase [Nocardioides sp. Kera G14]|uniref:family 43 glycosylhydrolase n=1 Tax=Nocardioides sp. Kera G14 TaxID=2884264 RepID=UPI001D113D27|nr:family 43 glycosylhydrolase [Nocardioides sp. Kera G14]UDY24648.1 family 43 glycosylhydrolase [Nocardioides sp. Kera G14]
MRRRRALVWVVAALAAATIMTTVPAAEAKKGPRPLVYRHSVADPSVAKVGPKKYVAVSTGKRVVRQVSSNGRTWRLTRTPLVRRPRWAKRTGGIWASEIVHIGRRWVLYFAAPARNRRGRCIGAAVSTSATGRFRAVPGRPLVCSSNRAGVIDPSSYVSGRRTYLLYKIDAKPSAIKLLRLNRAGTRRAARHSRVLVRSRGVVENPVILRRGGYYYLFTSIRSYATCNYATTVRRSRSLVHWRGHPARMVLSQHMTGLCGPGGADIVATKRGVTMYFHGWVCGGSTRPCTVRPHRARRAVRALYAVKLNFRHGWPVRAGYVKG